MSSGVRIKYVANRYWRTASGDKFDITPFSLSAANSARNFHRRFVNYKPTALVSLRAFARSLGITSLWIKDESQRFGLNAFKVLGASYAIGRFMAQRLGVRLEDISFDFLKSPRMKEDLGEFTFVTATDGNHGRAVAWAAQQLRQKAVIYLPQGASPARVASIRAHGAEANVTEGNYDYSVHHAAEMAERHGWILFQDTAWDGYEKIPTWIMQGYLTMFDEAIEQLNGDAPTHIFIQAGTGSLAGSLHGYIRERYQENSPLLYVVEPANAACFFKSIQANDGLPRTVEGELDTIMVGLAAGKPSSLGWRILRDYSDGFFACSDAVAAKGMQVLARPLAGDRSVVSGEAGAVTTGLLTCLSSEPKLRAIADEMQIDQNSKVLLFSTEGATDPETYRRIIEDNDIEGTS